MPSESYLGSLRATRRRPMMKRPWWKARPHWTPHSSCGYGISTSEWLSLSWTTYPLTTCASRPSTASIRTSESLKIYRHSYFISSVIRSSVFTHNQMALKGPSVAHEYVTVYLFYSINETYLYSVLNSMTHPVIFFIVLDCFNHCSTLASVFNLRDYFLTHWRPPMDKNTSKASDASNQEKFLLTLQSQLPEGPEATRL